MELTINQLSNNSIQQNTQKSNITGQPPDQLRDFVKNAYNNISLDKIADSIKTLPQDKQVDALIGFHALRLLSYALNNEGRIYDYFIKEPISLKPIVISAVLERANAYKQHLVNSGILPKDDETLSVFDKPDRASHLVLTQAIASGGTAFYSHDAKNFVIEGNKLAIINNILPSLEKGEISKFEDNDLYRGATELFVNNNKKIGIALINRYINKQLGVIGSSIPPQKIGTKSPKGLPYSYNTLLEIPVSIGGTKISPTEQFITKTTFFSTVEKLYKVFGGDKKLPALLRGAEKEQLYRTLYPESKTLLDLMTTIGAYATEFATWYAIGEITGGITAGISKTLGITDRLVNVFRTDPKLIARITKSVGDFVGTDIIQYNTIRSNLRQFYGDEVANEYKKKFGVRMIVASSLTSIMIPYTHYLTITRTTNTMQKLLYASVVGGVSTAYQLASNGIPNDPFGKAVFVAFPMVQAFGVLRSPTLPKEINYENIRITLKGLSSSQFDELYKEIKTGKVNFNTIAKTAEIVSDFATSPNTDKVLDAYKNLSLFVRLSGAEINDVPFDIVRYFRERAVSPEVGRPTVGKITHAGVNIEELNATNLEIQRIQELLEAQKREEFRNKLETNISQHKDVRNLFVRYGITITPTNIRESVGENYKIIATIPLSQWYLDAYSNIRNIDFQHFEAFEKELRNITDFAKFEFPEDARVRRKLYIVRAGNFNDALTSFKRVGYEKLPDGTSIALGYMIIPYDDEASYIAYKHNITKVLEQLGIRFNKPVGFNVIVIPEGNDARVIFNYIKGFERRRPVYDGFEIKFKNFNQVLDTPLSRDNIIEIRGNWIDEVSDFAGESKGLRIIDSDAGYIVSEIRPSSESQLTPRESRRGRNVEQGEAEGTFRVERSLERQVYSPNEGIVPIETQTNLTHREVLNIFRTERPSGVGGAIRRYDDVYVIEVSPDGKYGLYKEKYRDGELLARILLDEAPTRDELKIPDEILIKRLPPTERRIGRRKSFVRRFLEEIEEEYQRNKDEIDLIIEGKRKMKIPPEDTMSEWKEVLTPDEYMRMFITKSTAPGPDEIADELGITENELRQKILQRLRSGGKRGRIRALIQQNIDKYIIAKLKDGLLTPEEAQQQLKQYGYDYSPSELTAEVPPYQWDKIEARRRQLEEERIQLEQEIEQQRELSRQVLQNVKAIEPEDVRKIESPNDASIKGRTLYTIDKNNYYATDMLILKENPEKVEKWIREASGFERVNKSSSEIEYLIESLKYGQRLEEVYAKYVKVNGETIAYLRSDIFEEYEPVSGELYKWLKDNGYEIYKVIGANFYAIKKRGEIVGLLSKLDSEELKNIGKSLMHGDVESETKESNVEEQTPTSEIEETYYPESEFEEEYNQPSPEIPRPEETLPEESKPEPQIAPQVEYQPERIEASEFTRYVRVDGTLTEDGKSKYFVREFKNLSNKAGKEEIKFAELTRYYKPDDIVELGDNDIVVYRTTPLQSSDIVPEFKSSYEIKMRGLEKGLMYVLGPSEGGNHDFLFFNGYGITDDGYIVPVVQKIASSNSLDGLIEFIKARLKDGKTPFKLEDYFIDLYTGKPYIVGKGFELLPITEIKQTDSGIIFKTPNGNFKPKEIIKGLDRDKKLVKDDPRFTPKLNEQQKVMAMLEVSKGIDIEKYIIDANPKQIKGLLGYFGVNTVEELKGLIDDYKTQIRDSDLLMQIKNYLDISKFTDKEVDEGSLIASRILNYKNIDDELKKIIHIDNLASLIDKVGFWKAFERYGIFTIKDYDLIAKRVDEVAKEVLPQYLPDGTARRQIGLDLDENGNPVFVKNPDFRQYRHAIVFEADLKDGNVGISPKKVEQAFQLYRKFLDENPNRDRIIIRVSHYSEVVSKRGKKQITVNYALAHLGDKARIYQIFDDKVEYYEGITSDKLIAGNIAERGYQYGMPTLGETIEGEQIKEIESGGPYIELDASLFGVPFNQIPIKVVKTLHNFVEKILGGALQVINPKFSVEEIRNAINKIPDSAVATLKLLLSPDENNYNKISTRIMDLPDELWQKVDEYFNREGFGYSIDEMARFVPEDVREKYITNQLNKVNKAISRIKNAVKEAIELDEKAREEGRQALNYAMLVNWTKKFFNVDTEQAIDLLNNPEKIAHSTLLMLDPVFNNMREFGGVLTPRAHPNVYRVLVGLTAYNPDAFKIDKRLQFAIANPNFFPIAVSEINRENAYGLIETSMNRALSDIEKVMRNYGITHRVDEDEMIRVWDIFEEGLRVAQNMGLNAENTSRVIATMMAEKNVNPALLFVMARDPYNPLKIEDIATAYANHIEPEKIINDFMIVDNALTTFYKKAGMILEGELGTIDGAFSNASPFYIHRVYTKKLFETYGFKKAKQDLQELIRVYRSGEAEFYEFPILMQSKRTLWYNLDLRTQVRHYANYFSRTAGYNNVYPYAIGLHKLFAFDMDKSASILYNNALLGIFFGIDPAKGDVLNILGETAQLADIITKGREISYLASLAFNFSPAIKNWGQAWLLFSMVSPRYFVEGYIDAIKNPEAKRALNELLVAAEYGKVRSKAVRGQFTGDFTSWKIDDYINNIKDKMLPLLLWELADGSLRKATTITAYGIGKRLGLTIPEITKLSLYLEQATQFSFGMAGRPLYLYDKSLALAYKFTWFMKYPLDALSSFIIWNVKNGIYSPLVLSTVMGALVAYELWKKEGIDVSDITLSPIKSITGLASGKNVWIGQIANATKELFNSAYDIAKAVDWRSPDRFQQLMNISSYETKKNIANILPTLYRWNEYEEWTKRMPEALRKYGDIMDERRKESLILLFSDLARKRVRAKQIKDIRFLQDHYNETIPLALEYAKNGDIEKGVDIAMSFFNNDKVRDLAKTYYLFTPNVSGRPFVYLDIDKTADRNLIAMYLLSGVMREFKTNAPQKVMQWIYPAYIKSPVVGKSMFTQWELWRKYNDFEETAFEEWMRYIFGDIPYMLYKGVNQLRR